MTTDDTKTPISSQPSTKLSAWRRGGIAVALVAGGFALGTVSVVSAAGMGWHHGHHEHGPKVGMIQMVAHRTLDSVGATSAQEDKIHDIIAATYTQLEQGKADHEAMRKQALTILSAPTIDRAAAEKLRADEVAKFDAKSKVIVSAMLDAAAQLTPEQRSQLAQKIQDHMDDHGGFGGHHHHDGMDDHGPDGSDHGDH